MNIKYLNHPPYPNRWMICLIQQGLGLRTREQRALLSGGCVYSTLRLVYYCCASEAGQSTKGKSLLLRSRVTRDVT